MTLEDLIATKDIIDAAVLTRLAADEKAAGADVRAAFAQQAELRQRAATAMLDAVDGDRTGLLASEARQYDKLTREIDNVLTLCTQVGKRGEYQPPPTQVIHTERTTSVAPVVGQGESVRSWLDTRGGAAYAAERGAERLRFGAVVRALALGDKAGLSPLELRVLSEGTDASGGYTVPEILAASFIDRVRNAMVCMRAGAVTVPMTSDVLNIARLGQPDSGSPDIAAPTWKVENDPIPESDLYLERVRFTAKTLPTYLRLSVELSEDSTNVDAIIEREMAQALALELDRACLLGSGSGAVPRGIRNQSGVGVTSYAGVQPDDYDFVIDAIGRVWGQNHEPNARITNAALATLMAKFKGQDNQPLRVPDVVAAVPAYRTNQIPSVGASPDSSTLFVGDFTQLLVGLRTSFRLEVSRVAGDVFKNLQIAVRAYLRADVQLAHPEAFDVTTDVGHPN